MPRLALYESLYAAVTLPGTLAHAKAAFADMDPTGRGYITSEDIKRRMTTVGHLGIAVVAGEDGDDDDDGDVDGENDFGHL